MLRAAENWVSGHWTMLLHSGASVLDVLIVAYFIYKLMMLAKGTRAWQIILGLLVFVAILLFSSWAQLIALEWLLKQMFLLGPVAIVILFYPELRHALEEVGRIGFWGRGFSGLEKEDLSAMLGQIVIAADSFSDTKTGALIVLERETGLTEQVDNGTLINALVSADLLATIFYAGTPLHDGAVIIRRDRVVAAGCTLPLSESREIGAHVHTRHKAALGITEQSDSVAVVVSEETGTISVAHAGKMVRGLRGEDLRDRLVQVYLGRQRMPLRRRRGLSPKSEPKPKDKPTLPVVNIPSWMPTLAATTARVRTPLNNVARDAAGKIRELGSSTARAVDDIDDIKLDIDTTAAIPEVPQEGDQQ
jgi:diadenylate cyclase